MVRAGVKGPAHPTDSIRVRGPLSGRYFQCESSTTTPETEEEVTSCNEQMILCIGYGAHLTCHATSRPCPGQPPVWEPSRKTR